MHIVAYMHAHSIDQL